MNKSDYNEISRSIRDTEVLDPKGIIVLDKNKLIEKLISYFNTVNPRFDENKFKEYCK